MNEEGRDRRKGGRWLFVVGRILRWKDNEKGDVVKEKLRFVQRFEQQL